MMARWNLRAPSFSLGALGDVFSRTMLLYVVYSVVLFAVFLVATFPYEIVVARALALVESSAVDVDFKEAKFAWHRGLALTGVRLSSPTAEPAAAYVDLDTLWIRPVLSELISGNPYALALQADLYGGEAQGTLNMKGNVLAGTISLNGVSLGRVTTLAQMLEEGRLAGRIFADLSFEAAGANIDGGQASGNIRLEKGSLEKAKISGFGVPDLHFETSQLAFALGGGRLEIEQFDASGEELNVSASGQVSLRNPLDTSVLNLKATVLPGRNPPDAIRGLISMIPKPRDAKPDTPLRISGTVSKPRFR
jgi:type II secretion system protein N